MGSHVTWKKYLSYIKGNAFISYANTFMERQSTLSFIIAPNGFSFIR